MHRVPASSRVRRRLFADEPVDEARVDNFANALQEERIEKIKKWNFDFVNEKPLEGNYEWFRRCDSDPDVWIRMEPEKTTEDDPKDITTMQTENETTPKGNKDEEIPQIRKRKQDVNSQIDGKGVRRRISFDSE